MRYLISIFFLYSTTLFAWQVPLSGGFQVEGGFSKQATSMSWAVGGNVNWRVNDWYSFEPGLQYSKDGEFGFVTLPVLSKLSVTLDGFDPYIFLGPYFSVVSSKPDQSFKSVDIGSVQGIGCFIPINYKFALNVDVRFKIGATDLDSREDVALRMRNIQLSLAAVFPL